MCIYGLLHDVKVFVLKSNSVYSSTDKTVQRILAHHRQQNKEEKIPSKVSNCLNGKLFVIKTYHW